MKTSEILKMKREQLGMSLQQVGDYIGVSKVTIAKYESGDIKTLKQENIEKLSQLFNVSPGYIMGWENESGEPTKTYIEKKSFVTELLETMVRNGMIDDPDNIDDKMMKMIVEAVKLEAARIKSKNI